MMTSYPPSFLPLISVWHFTSLLHVANNVTALRVTVLRYDFVGIVVGIKWFLLGGYSWVRRQFLFKPQEIRLDKVLYILNFLLQLCGTFILVQFCNLSYLLGVPPITLHIHNKKVKKRISIQLNLIIQEMFNGSQLKNQQQNVMNYKYEREFNMKKQQFAPAVCFPLLINSPP